MINETNKDKHCIGCGIPLQTSDPNARGYTPKAFNELNTTICQRCFRIRHYQEDSGNKISESEYMTLLETFHKENALAVLVIDLFDSESSLLPQFSRLLHQKDVLVVANKRDLLPKSISDGRLRHRLEKRLHESDIKPREIILISAVKNHGIDTVLEAIDRLANGRNSYLLGMSNVGKSSLINAFFRATTGQDSTPITVSRTLGTTLDLIPITFENTTLYDTPGLLPRNHMSAILLSDSYRLLQPTKEIKPISYQLNPQQTLFLGGLVRIDHIGKKPATFIVYAAPTLPIHRCKQDRADLVYEQLVYKELTPPTLKDPPIEFTHARHNIKSKSDFVISGLGFVTIIGPTTIYTHTPKNVYVYLKEALIG